ncbi:unnamed protein product, partial [Amoebophrya sp. A120]
SFCTYLHRDQANNRNSVLGTCILMKILIRQTKDYRSSYGAPSTALSFTICTRTLPKYIVS